MALPRNSRSFSTAFAGFGETVRNLLVDKPKAYVADLRVKLRDLPQTNFDLGCDFAARGLWSDAAFRFRVAIYLQPQFAQAYYNLGCCQVRLGQKSKARQSFLKTLRLVPDHAEAQFMLSALDPAAVPVDKRPTRIPAPMVKEFFGGVAANYDAIEASNDYQGAKVVYDAIKPLIGDRKDLVVLDIACGSGIVARPWRPLAKQLVGIELTPAMADTARLAKVADAPLFDAVLEEDALHLAESKAPFSEADLLLVVNAAQFIGHLAPLLEMLGQRMKPGALLALTYEPFDAAAGFQVNIDTGRFGHHPHYIKQAMQHAGLQAKQENRVQLYPQFATQLLVMGK